MNQRLPRVAVLLCALVLDVAAAHAQTRPSFLIDDVAAREAVVAQRRWTKGPGNGPGPWWSFLLSRRNLVHTKLCETEVRVGVDSPDDVFDAGVEH